jgi:hypothetical protein
MPSQEILQWRIMRNNFKRGAVVTDRSQSLVIYEK